MVVRRVKSHNNLASICWVSKRLQTAGQMVCGLLESQLLIAVVVITLYQLHKGNTVMLATEF